MTDLQRFALIQENIGQNGDRQKALFSSALLCCDRVDLEKETQIIQREGGGERLIAQNIFRESRFLPLQFGDFLFELFLVKRR
jgi:hypothetical protein